MKFFISPSLILIAVFTFSCNSLDSKQNKLIQASGSMHEMIQGAIGPSVALEQIVDKENLYAIGPNAFMKGELMIWDGIPYVSKVDSHGSMTVTESWDSGAPFLVYANIRKWEEVSLPQEKLTHKGLEELLTQKSANRKAPFAFKLTGKMRHVDMHVQNLPTGSPVGSMAEVHKGQTSFLLGNVDGDVLGFFSKESQGVYTHHDSYIHMHLISKDRKQMGHLDELEFDGSQVSLYISSVDQ
ncbi:MAG: acetolactate decarboxylase [Bacteroidia bacterium]|nr:acetolactate decarboxylase [Bacteroidia bacterium]